MYQDEINDKEGFETDYNNSDMDFKRFESNASDSNNHHKPILENNKEVNNAYYNPKLNVLHSKEEMVLFISI